MPPLLLPTLNNGGWSATYLRPARPLRACPAVEIASSSSSSLCSGEYLATDREDAMILEVIDAYFSAGKAKKAHLRN